MLVLSRSTASTVSCLRWNCRSDRSSLIAEKSRPTLTCVTGSAASARLQPHRSGGWDGFWFWWGCLSTLYSAMQAQKRRVYNQMGGVHHHQLQEYAFRVSASSKIETESQRDTTKCPAISCPTITQPCSKAGWDDVPHIPFCKKNQRKVGRPSMADPERGLWEGPISKRYPDF